MKDLIMDLAGDHLAPPRPPAPAPVAGQSWEERVTALLGDHAGHEAQIVADYRRFSQEVSDPAVRYLIDLVVDDEDRHHRLLAELVEAVVAATDRRSAASALPTLGLGPQPPELRERTRHFLSAEDDDAHQLRALRKAMRDVRDTTIWALLVELMELDTQKHRRILSFIERHSREAST
jgi:rubrerythrin